MKVALAEAAAREEVEADAEEVGSEEEVEAGAEG